MSDKQRSTICCNDLLKKIAKVSDIPIVLLLDFGCGHFIKIVCKTFAFRIMNNEVLTNGAIPYTMIYRVLSACIEYPAAILESRNCSLNLSKPLSVDRNDWLLSTTCKA